MHLQKQLSSQFDNLIAYIEKINALNSGSANALLVIQQDRIVTESYSGFHSQLPNARPIQADSQFNVASVRKSYLGFAVAHALYLGQIGSIDDPVTDYLPELDRTVMQYTTLRHLLTHTHGLTTDDNGRLTREFDVAKNWAYRGENIEMLTEIIHRVTGKTLAENLQELVFAPLEFTETGWRSEKEDRLVQTIYHPTDPPEWKLGTPSGTMSNLFVSARELAYWGYLHLKKGKINGRQVVPSAVIEMATTVQSPELPNPELPPNGFLWYVQDRPAKFSEIGPNVPKGSFQILGISGPLVLVIPDHELVVVRMYNKYYNYGGPEGDYLAYLREFGNRVMECLK